MEILTDLCSDIVRSYGDWTTFMASFNLSSFDDDDVDEAKGILESFVEASQDEA